MRGARLSGEQEQGDEEEPEPSHGDWKPLQAIIAPIRTVSRSIGSGRNGQYPGIEGLRDRLRSLPPAAVVAALVAASAALRFWAGTKVPTPWIVPDEFVYGELGRSLYATGGFEILDQPVRFYTLVVPALVGLPLSAGGETGYALLKALQALVMSSAAVPVYLWTRTLASRGWALAAAALTLTPPGLAYSGLIMTEAAFYPVVVWTAWAMARSLERPTLSRQLLALAAIVAACATRLQALALVAVLVSAVGLELLFTRTFAGLRRHLPALVGIALLSAAWIAWSLRHGGPATDVLGAYRAAGEVSYDAGKSARYALWHAADVVILAGFFPVCAVALLLVSAIRRREVDAPLRAYLAVAASLAFWFTLEVGVFASRHVGRLAERDLLSLAPVLFVGFAVWLHRGAPRPRVATGIAAAAAFALLLYLPIDTLVSLAAIPDAFTLIPLHKLELRAPALGEEWVLAVAGAAAAAAFALVPRRLVWTLPVAAGVTLGLASVSASRVVAAEATLVRRSTLGQDKDWVERSGADSVSYVYSGEVFWNAVYENVFWNRNVDRVYALLTARVPGLTPAQHPSVGPYEDGRVVLADGRPPVGRYALAASRVTFVGTRIAEAPLADLFVWRLEPPFRLESWVDFRQPPSGVGVDLEARAYACRGGHLVLRLYAPRPATVAILRGGLPYRTLRVRAGERWRGRIPAAVPRPAGRRLCSFQVRSRDELQVTHARYVR